MKNIPLLAATLLGTLALIVGVTFFFSGSSTNNAQVDPAKLTENASPAAIKGGGNEPKVTVVEFSDFQCPACKATEPFIKEVTQKYPDQVKFVYRHFPLTAIHPYAVMAAQAAEAAGEQGKFWEMHDLLFERQETWEALKSEEEVKQEFVKYAEELMIDKQKFAETIQSEAVKKRVAQDAALGSEIGVQATPTIYVNGQKVTAPQQLLPTVESLLK